MQKQASNEGWSGFIDLLCDITDKTQMHELLQLFLTIDEHQDLADRYLIVQHLLAGKLTQRELATKLGVSISKITRGSNSIKLLGGKLRQHLQKQMS